MSARGFTIIEAAIMIAVVGILSVITVIVISGSISNIQLGSAGDKLAADLRYAQSMAAGEGQWYGVSFEVNPTNRYTLYTTTGTVDTVVNDPNQNGHSFIVYTNTLFNVTLNATIEGGRKVEFSPLGTPYADKNNPTGISSEGIVTLTRGTSGRTVRITPNTGRIYSQ